MARDRVGKNNRPNKNNTRRRNFSEQPLDEIHPQPRTQRSRKPLTALTDAQEAYMNAIDVYPLVFCKGPAGTGKTYIAAAAAAEAIAEKRIKKIIITRPAVGADEEYGFLPGELEEKIAPWAAPVISILEERLGAGAVEYMLASKQIEIAPLGMLRGHTFNDAWVIFDEAQNATRKQMKLFLTRFGKNCKMVVDADPFDQCDLPAGVEPGFNEAWEIMQGHQEVGFIEFTIDDIVRSGLCRDVLIRYSNKGTPNGQRSFGHLGVAAN